MFVVTTLESLISNDVTPLVGSDVTV